MAEINHLNSRYYIEGLLAVLIFGITPLFIKEVSANAYTIGLVRLVIGSSFLFVMAKPSKLKKLNKSEWKALVFIGLLFGVHWITYFISIKLATPSMGILAVSSFGLHMIYLNWIIKGQKPKAMDLFTVLLAVTGIFFIVPEFTLKNNLTAGILIGLVSGLLFAGLPFLQQKHQSISSFSRAFGQYAFALPVFLLFTHKTNWTLSTTDWWYLIILGTLCTVVAHTLWLRATTMLEPTTTSLIFYLGTPIAMTCSYFFLDEPMGTSKVIGAGLIISANVLGVISRSRKRHKPSSPNKD
ncbi:DMT family transporter [Roseivirga pacifica]|uniref:DMT family transporter n=1 Tax=Roseivirga pacifica TaxID=1267423 RepID=UPI003BAC572A